MTAAPLMAPLLRGFFWVLGAHPSAFLWERACSRWSSTMTRENRTNAAHLSPSPASRLLQSCERHTSLVGASLLAMDVNEYASCLEVRVVRTFFASRLAPTEKQKPKAAHTHAPHHSSGRALARLQLLILIHPPPRKAEWRCLSGDWRAAPFDVVELIACRSKRSRPEGNAPG
jgi:hypothetical protein